MSIVLVGTPIGNLGDISPRAVEALRDADLVFCEDTRRTRQLLSALGIPAAGRLVAMHAHNEEAAAERAVAAAAEGRAVAVVSDAGMPGVSDPGERVVSRAVEAGLQPDVIPGPVAAVAALVLSGLPGARWAFEGFLPRSGGDRTRRIGAIAVDERTTVLYEAPHRALRTLGDLRAACGGERRVAVGRELTKLHQELWRGTLAEAVAWASSGTPRGEWVLVVEGAPAEAPAEVDIEGALRAQAEAGVDRKTAVAAVAAASRAPKKSVYEASLGIAWPPRD